MYPPIPDLTILVHIFSGLAIMEILQESLIKLPLEDLLKNFRHLVLTVKTDEVIKTALHIELIGWEIMQMKTSRASVGMAPSLITSTDRDRSSESSESSDCEHQREVEAVGERYSIVSMESIDSDQAIIADRSDSSSPKEDDRTSSHDGTHDSGAQTPTLSEASPASQQPTKTATKAAITCMSGEDMLLWLRNLYLMDAVLVRKRRCEEWYKKSRRHKKYHEKQQIQKYVPSVRSVPSEPRN